MFYVYVSFEVDEDDKVTTEDEAISVVRDELEKVSFSWALEEVEKG